MDTMAAVDPRPNEIVGDFIHWHTFESMDKKEVDQFFEEKKPEMWERFIRKDPETMRAVYVLRWFHEGD